MGTEIDTGWKFGAPKLQAASREKDLHCVAKFGSADQFRSVVDELQSLL